MEHESNSRYFRIWIYLMFLIGLGLSVALFPFSKPAAVTVIFAIAFVKAVLVVRNFMHLKDVPLMLYVIAGLPVLLAITMAAILIPDIGFRG